MFQHVSTLSPLQELFVDLDDEGAPEAETPSESPGTEVPGVSDADLEAKILRLKRELGDLSKPPEPPADEVDHALEVRLASLRKALQDGDIVSRRQHEAECLGSSWFCQLGFPRSKGEAAPDHAETQALTPEQIEECCQAWKASDTIYNKYGLFFAPHETDPPPTHERIKAPRSLFT